MQPEYKLLVVNPSKGEDWVKDMEAMLNDNWVLVSAVTDNTGYIVYTLGKAPDVPQSEQNVGPTKKESPIIKA